MAKVTITNQHDWCRFILKFPTVKITTVYNRGGSSIKLDPYDGAELRRVCEVLDYAYAANRLGTDVKFTVGDILDVVVAVAGSAKNVNEFLELFSDRMESAYGLSKTGRFASVPRGATSVTTARENKGWRVKASFSNGDDFDLKINGSSMSALMNPPLNGLADQVTQTAFGLLAIHRDPQAVAERLRDAAMGSSSVENWIDNISASHAPRP